MDFLLYQLLLIIFKINRGEKRKTVDACALLFCGGASESARHTAAECDRRGRSDKNSDKKNGNERFYCNAF